MPELIRIKADMARFMTIYKLGVNNRHGTETLEKKWERINFKNLSFRYKQKYVLKDFNLNVQKGEKIGIVGKTGSGKSTLIKLLLGLYPLQKGKISIGGKTLESYSQETLNDNFSVVLQESEMFNTSLKENVMISAKEHSNKRFKKALEISQLDELVGKLPQSVHSLLGEKGYKVSGGERQRVGIARAIYKNTPILILDEATSALDSKTEKKIQEAMNTTFADKTMIIIAHRLSTLKNTDRIIVLDKGKIVEEGSFNSLLKQKGLFYEYYELQKKEEQDI